MWAQVVKVLGMAGFDIIGDIHGCADELEQLLDQLGYRIDLVTGAYRHESRHALFVGDLVDRGPAQLRVLEIVKGMVDEGFAQIVMGNHEFNALAYATEDPEQPGHFLRPQSEKNLVQHEAFLTQLTQEQREHYLAWFITMPLWLDTADLDSHQLRVVHACWHEPSINRIKELLGGSRFTSPDQLAEAARKSEEPDSLYRAVDTVLKGPELRLARYGAPPFMDKDGHVRKDARVRWWKSGAKTVAELAEVPGDSRTQAGEPYGELPDVEVDAQDRSFSYASPVPVFYGHYWRTDVPVEHEDWTPTTACVDFSAVKGGTLVAYRWDGERTINWRRYHPHGRNLIERSPSS